MQPCPAATLCEPASGFFRSPPWGADRSRWRMRRSIFMSATATAPPRAGAARSIRLALAPLGSNPGIVRIAVGKVIADYRVWPLASDFGSSFALEKFGAGERYHVLLDSAGGQHSCECKGFLRWGHCKHVEGLLALRKAGQL